MFSKSLRGQMFPHIPLFTKEPECFPLFFRVCIREKWQRACGVTEPSHLSPPMGYGVGVEKSSEDLWRRMPTNVSHLKRSQLCGACCKANQQLWLEERQDFCLTLTSSKAFLSLCLLSWCLLSVKWMGCNNHHPLWLSDTSYRQSDVHNHESFKRWKVVQE